MKTLRITLAVVTALTASAAFAGPRGKSTPPRSASATYRADSGSAEAKMFEKSGKRTKGVDCTNETAKCKAHCGN
jgi:hypothetical protein